jgi:hypothetical protein
MILRCQGSSVVLRLLQARLLQLQARLLQLQAHTITNFIFNHELNL